MLINNSVSIIYTDGSCLKNPGGPGGWCCLIEEEELWILSGGEPETTNNRMELTAVNEALAICPGEECIIYTDSNLTLNCAKGIWKRKSNLDLWNIFDSCSKNIKIRWEWVKAHGDNEFNNLVDEMARKEAKNVKK
tara:strand:+ start:62 stop:469 length:408 start_codon:yes stop_codon:yes gene_type:complete